MASLLVHFWSLAFALFVAWFFPLKGDINVFGFLHFHCSLHGHISFISASIECFSGSCILEQFLLGDSCHDDMYFSSLRLSLVSFMLELYQSSVISLFSGWCFEASTRARMWPHWHKNYNARFAIEQRYRAPTEMKCPLFSSIEEFIISSSMYAWWSFVFATDLLWMKLIVVLVFSTVHRCRKVSLLRLLLSGMQKMQVCWQLGFWPQEILSFGTGMVLC